MPITDPTDEQIAKLPQWARHHIGRQQQVIGELTEERDALLRQVARDPEGSDTFVDGYGLGPDLPLGHQPRIRFGADRYAAVTAHLRDDGSVVVSAGWGGLTVTPQHSNVIYVRATP